MLIYKEYILHYTILDENGDNVIKRIHVMATDQTISDLMNDNYNYYEFLVDDNAKFYLSGNCIGSLKEVVDGQVLELPHR